MPQPLPLAEPHDLRAITHNRRDPAHIHDDREVLRAVSQYTQTKKKKGEKSTATLLAHCSESCELRRRARARRARARRTRVCAAAARLLRPPAAVERIAPVPRESRHDLVRPAGKTSIVDNIIDKDNNVLWNSKDSSNEYQWAANSYLLPDDAKWSSWDSTDFDYVETSEYVLKHEWA